MRDKDKLNLIDKIIAEVYQSSFDIDGRTDAILAAICAVLDYESEEV